MKLGQSLLPGLAATAVLSAGCTWITPADLESARDRLDDDQDGYTAAEDCDDSDATSYPGAEDAWYDGFDKDCAGDDDFDADTDGYVPDEYVGQVTQGVETSGLLPGGDCDDADPDASPASADAWYDGVDTDCDGRDDFDADEDGYPTGEVEYGPTENAPGTGSLDPSKVDCDEDDPDINPGATEVWYDGIDANCDTLDDYDADQDGWVPEAWLDDPDSQDADCDDADADINPGATELWYDGVDQDCEEDFDYDADADGFVPSEHLALVSTEVQETYGIDPDLADCDDTDGEVYPGATELLFDSTDDDCDGSAETFELTGLEGFTWTGPHDPRFDENSSTIYLAVAADEVQFTSPGATTETHLYESIIAMAWDSIEPEAGLDSVVQFQRNAAYPGWQLSDGFELMVNDDALYGTFGFRYDSTGSRGLRLAAYTLDPVGRKGTSFVPGTYADFGDLSLAEDQDGNLHAIGCESTEAVAQHIWASTSSLSSNTSDGSGLFDLESDLCRLHFYEADPVGTIVTSRQGALAWYTFDRPASGSGIETVTYDSEKSHLQPLDIEILRETSSAWIVIADEASDSIVFVDDAGNEVEHAVTGGVISVDWRVTPSGEIVVAYVDGSGVPGMLLGDPDTGFEQASLDPGFTCTEASAHVSDDGESLFFVAVSATEGELAVGRALLP